MQIIGFILLFALLSLAPRAGAQTCCPYIDQTSIIPANPNAGDSVFFAYQVTNPSQGNSLGCSVIPSGNRFDISCCFYNGMLPATQTYTDTLFLGVLGQGQFQVFFLAFASSDDINCIPFQSNADTLDFTVLPALSMHQQHWPKASLSGNLSGPVLPEALKRGPYFQIYDFSGRMVGSSERDADHEAGCYLIFFPSTPENTLRWMKTP
jgi:hypothetical protein